MKDKLQEITKRAMEQIDAAEEMSALNDVRVAVLGKKGELTAVLKSMKDVKPEYSSGSMPPSLSTFG